MGACRCAERVSRAGAAFCVCVVGSRARCRFGETASRLSHTSEGGEAARGVVASAERVAREWPLRDRSSLIDVPSRIRECE